MTTRGWIHPYVKGDTNYSWNNPLGWAQTGTPQAGDTLTMAFGRMDIYNSKLPAELYLGHGDIGPAIGPITLNFVNADATLGVVGTTHLNFVEQEDPFTITAYGKVHITADNLAAITGTVDVGANSNLVVTGKMTFAYDGHLDAIGTGGTITNNGLISIARGDISARVNGHGTLELHNYHDGTGWQTISGAIGAGQDVVLVAHNHETRTELVDLKTFKASLEIADLGSQTSSSLLEVDGVHASRMDIRNDMLRLYGTGNKPLWQVHEHMPAGCTASMSNTATGTEIMFTPHQLVG